MTRRRISSLHRLREATCGRSILPASSANGTSIYARSDPLPPKREGPGEEIDDLSLGEVDFGMSQSALQNFFFDPSRIDLAIDEVGVFQNLD